MEEFKLVKVKSLSSLWPIYIKFFILLTLLIFWVPLCPQADAGVSFKAEVNKSIIEIDETLTYKLTVFSDERNIPSPKLPDFSGFLVASQNQSSTISIDKGKIKTKIVYIFVLMPKASGKFKIEPASIKIKNQTYYTDSFEIEVKESKERLPSRIPYSPPSDSESPSPEELPYESESPKITL